MLPLQRHVPLLQRLVLLEQLLMRLLQHLLPRPQLVLRTLDRRELGERTLRRILRQARCLGRVVAHALERAIVLEDGASQETQVGDRARLGVRDQVAERQTRRVASEACERARCGALQARTRLVRREVLQRSRCR